MTRLIEVDRLVPMRLVATASRVHAVRPGSRTAECGLAKGLPWLKTEDAVSCPRHPAEGERFHLDHKHGERPLRIRGTLCAKDNRNLRAWMNPPLLRAMADYLERTAA